MSASALRFRFELTPLDEVTGWGASKDSLHWFGLTDGRYWIEGDGVVQPPGEIDYYVARLWEDVIRLATMLREPAPRDLEALLLSDPGSWTDPFADDSWEAVSWHGDHLLDLGYVTGAPEVIAWRSADAVTIRWSARRSGPDDGHERRSTSVSLPAAAFRAAVVDFDREFLEAMTERVREVAAGHVPPGTSVDVEHLLREHADRTGSLRLSTASPQRATQWDAVRSGAALLLGTPR